MNSAEIVKTPVIDGDRIYQRLDLIIDGKVVAEGITEEFAKDLMKSMMDLENFHYSVEAGWEID